ncbi:hypothetical protein J1N35_013952 [Gossypium stocksii]|uniref:Uncharacterized protein n=1 Tax=Gossypium stocksii TaxID=47602 RepID=A0A9D3VUT5_9ROSI|nr:hypothetical protein J1N35_013952 [Gossypium stocksii]
MAILFQKVVKLIEFYLGELIFDEIAKYIENLITRLLSPYPYLIFQVLYSQNSRIVHATEQYGKPILQLKFSHKWLEGKHVLNKPKKALGSNPEKAKKEEATS